MPGTELTVPNVVLGLMRIADKSDDEIRALLSAARDAGIAFLDHADVYGTRLHECEERFAQAMRLTPADRDELVIQTKAGIVRGAGFDFSYEHIVESVDGSLAALGTDHLDILLLHRPDALVEPEEVARAFDELEAAGLEYARIIATKSPQAIRMLKFAFNLADDGLAGQQVFAGEATRLAYGSDEAVEGRDAFLQHRDPDWSGFPYAF